MKSKQIFIAIIIYLGLAFGLPVLAAHLVPKLSPLQPLPGNTAPNISKNINTPGNSFNQSQLQAQQEVIPATPALNDQNNNQPSPVGQLAAVSTGGSGATYWFLLIASIAGLLLVGIWSYFRFARKGKI